MTRLTTIAAAKAIKPIAGTQRSDIYNWLKAQGSCGGTLEEMEHSLGLSGNTVRPRRCELENMGLIKDSGFRRHTSSGREAIVWVIVPEVELEEVA